MSRIDFYLVASIFPLIDLRFRFIGFPVMFLVLIIGICLSIVGFQKLKNRWVLRKLAEKTKKYNNSTHNPQVIKEKGKSLKNWEYAYFT